MNKKKAIEMASRVGSIRALEKAWNISRKEINRIKIEKVKEEAIQEFDYETFKNNHIIFASDDETQHIVKELNKKNIKIIEVKMR